MYSEFLNRTMKERLKGGSMKKLKSVMGLFTLLLVVFSATISSISASAATEQEEISSMIQEHVDKAKIPSVSTGMIRGDFKRKPDCGSKYAIHYWFHFKSLHSLKYFMVRR